MNGDEHLPGNDEITWPEGGPVEERPVPDGHEFSLLLTHDIDRPYKTYQSVYYALTRPDRRAYHLSTLRPGVNPYWRVDDLLALEESLDVRSAWYFLSEQRLLRDRPPAEWFTMEGWQLFAGRYDLSDPQIRELVDRLDRGGWEVGLHGSYESYDDPDRLAAEKARIEEALGRPVTGGRQHYLNLRTPDTWEHQRDLGLRYDASLGTSSTAGFDDGYGIVRPFGDEFVVFPLTVMEQSIPDPGDDFGAAWDACEELLREARDEGAVMSVLWHLRYFADRDFPGYTRIYRRLIERAKDLGGWVGSPGEFYELMELDELDRADGAAPSARRDDTPSTSSASSASPEPPAADAPGSPDSTAGR